MWTIIELGGTEKRYTLLTQKEYVVGRKDADILVPNDPSISRKHAVITLSFNEANISKPHQLPVFILKDVSRLGTVVMGDCIKNAEKEISSGDVITFGTTGNSKFQAVYEPYILTTSCISGPFKKGVKTMVAKLGGHTISEWRKDCQLLVMSNLNVTVKVICALVSLKPIVTPQYLEDLIKSIEDKTSLLNAESYHPPLAESQLDPDCVSFNPVKERQTLFQGKIFIFLSPKQFKKLSTVIELASGTPMLMEEGTDNNEDDILVSPATCVMMCDQTEASQMTQNGQTWISHVVKFLKKHKKRPITDPEIGYAILYCSTEDNCNPDKELPPTYVSRPEGVSQSLSQVPQQTQSEVLAENTEFNTTIQKKTITTARGDITHVDETKLDIQIKEEPVSQLRSQSAKKQTLRKRQLEEPVKGEDVVQPRTKRQVLDVPVKQEVFTPQAAHDISSAHHESRSTRSKDEGYGPISASRTTRSRSRSPAPVVKEPRSTRSRDKAPDPVSASRTTRSRSRSPATVLEEHRSTRSHKSPSPSPGTSTAFKDNKKIRQVKEEDVSINQVEDFDHIPDRKTRKRNNDVKQEQPLSASKAAPAETVEVFDEDMEMDSILADIDTSVDDFNAVPSRKTRSKREVAKGHTDAIQSKTDTNVVVNPQETENRKTMNHKPTVKEGHRPGVSLVYCREKEETSSVPRVKTELSKYQEENTDVANMSNAMYLEGFLSTVRPIEEQNVKISEFSAKEESLPVKCVILEERSLLARKPGVGKDRDRVIRKEGNYCIWKGKKVKNFKKFNKVTRLNLDGLPTIIGGSDLVVHESKPREELEEWFREEKQAESQQNEMDKMAMEMFDYEPPGRKRKH